MMRYQIVGVLLLLCQLLNVIPLQEAAATDFRMESTVFSGKEKEPISRSTTLFHVGVVYDFLNDSSRVAVLDQSRGRIILLDSSRNEKTELKLEEIAAYTAQTKSLAGKSLNGFLKFAANPEFQIKLNDSSDEIEFNATQLSYRIKTVVAKSPEAAKQYREFTNWYAQLNAMMNPAALPPFPRMVVNEALAERELLPESVELNIPKQIALGGRSLHMHSEHIVTWRLLQKDLDKIAATGSNMANFKEVSFQEFSKNLNK